MRATPKYGSWRGLFHKEWMISRAEVLTLILLNIAIGLGLPFVIRKAFDIPQDISDGLNIFVGIWLIAHMFIGLKLLYTSFRYEMKHPDIWLHSPKPIIQLVGVKAIFSSFITLGLLIIGSIALGMSLNLNNMTPNSSLIDGILVSLSVVIATFLISIYVMAIGFFFLCIYQVLRSRIGSIAVVITPGIFLGLTYILEKVRIPDVFNSIRSFGPARFTNTKFYDETNHNLISLIVPDGFAFTVGGLLLYGAIAMIFFTVGSLLFEKKARF